MFDSDDEDQVYESEEGGLHDNVPDNINSFIVSSSNKNSMVANNRDTPSMKAKPHKKSDSHVKYKAN